MIINNKAIKLPKIHKVLVSPSIAETCSFSAEALSFTAISDCSFSKLAAIESTLCCQLTVFKLSPSSQLASFTANAAFKFPVAVYQLA